MEIKKIRQMIYDKRKLNNIDATEEELKGMIQWLSLQGYLPKLPDYIEFRNGILKLAEKLNEKTKHGKVVYVLVPGDSGFRPTYFIEILNLCPGCIFIPFPLSDMIGNYNEGCCNKTQTEIEAYIEHFLPELDSFDVEQFVILDYIARGATIIAILNAMRNKYSKFNEFTTFRRNAFGDISKHLQYKHSNMFNDENTLLPPTANYVINVIDFFKGKCIDLLMDAPKHCRCIKSECEYNIPRQKIDYFNSDDCIVGKFIIYVFAIFHENYEKVIEKLDNQKQLVNNISSYKNKILKISVFEPETQCEITYEGVTLTNPGYGGKNTACFGNIKNKCNRTIHLSTICAIEVQKCLGDINFDKKYSLYDVSLKNGTKMKKMLYTDFEYCNNKILQFISLKNLTNCNKFHLRYAQNIGINDIKVIKKSKYQQKITNEKNELLTYKDIQNYSKSVVQLTTITGTVFVGFISSIYYYWYDLITTFGKISICHCTITKIERLHFEDYEPDIAEYFKATGQITTMYVDKIGTVIPRETKECTILYVSDNIYEITGCIVEYDYFDKISIQDNFTKEVIIIYKENILKISLH